MALAAIRCPHCDASREMIRAWRTFAEMVFVCGQCAHMWILDLEAESQCEAHTEAVPLICARCGAIIDIAFTEEQPMRPPLCEGCCQSAPEFAPPQGPPTKASLPRGDDDRAVTEA